MTLLIDAKEERDVAVAEIPGAYLHASFPPDKKVILKLNGVFVDIMCSVNPAFEEHIMYEKNRRGRDIQVLYIRVLRALYGCLELALLWYNLYSSTLVDLGFKINPYDRCVVRKMIDRHQCTVVFYVDDNNISHKDPRVVTQVINSIFEHFGELTVSRGKTHNFLGMNITIENQLVHIEMKDQILEAIEWGKTQGGCKPPNPAKFDLFEVDEDSIFLDDKDAEIFHSVVQKLLYICK